VSLGTEYPEWFFGDLRPMDEWIRDEHPSPEVQQVVCSWIDGLLDNHSQPPSVPVWAHPHDYRYDNRGARVENSDGVGVTYTVDLLTGQIDLDRVGKGFPLPSDPPMLGM